MKLTVSGSCDNCGFHILLKKNSWNVGRNRFTEEDVREEVQESE